MTVCNFVQNNFKKQTGQFVINVKGASIKDSQKTLLKYLKDYFSDKNVLFH